MSTPALSVSKTEVSEYSPDIEGYYIVQFKGPVHEDWKQEVMDTGAIIFDYIPNNAFIVRMTPSVKSQVEALDNVQWVGVYHPAYRVSPALNAPSTAALTADTEEVTEDIIVLLFDANDNERVISEINNLGGEIVEHDGDILRVRIDHSGITDIATINGVSWIEKYVQPVIFNDVAANITNVYTVRNTYGLTGSGQIVAVADTGLDTGVNDDTMHDDLEGRIIQIYDIFGDGADDVRSGHGTHVAGSVLGNGSNSSGQFSGMAPNAQLVFQAMEDDYGDLHLPTNFTDLFQQAYNDNAKIHSNSWGFSDSGLYGNYTTYSEDVDSFMWNNPDMLIIFAAGNNGSYGDYTVLPPATAKNCLSIGASESSRFGGNVDTNASFSSRGPTDDGRIKPDLVAPGTWIISTRSSAAPPNGLWGDYNAYYRYSGGTSMSTPLVAGTAALVRQYYVQNESITPTAALLKATLINGADNLSLSVNSQGWGRVDLENSLYPSSPRTMRYHDNITLITSGLWNTSYYVSNSSEPLRITLVWTDYPAAAYAALTLVNNLDLTVTGPGGTYYGNGATDSLNNVEEVELLSPSAGSYTVQISGTNIPQGPQPFALVVSGALNAEPLVTSYTANPSTIEANGTDNTTFNVNATDPDGIASVTMDLSEIGGSAAQALANNSGVWQYTTNTTELGTFDLPVNVTDSLGVSNTSFSITLVTHDKTAPTSNSPADIGFSANATANFTYWKLFDLHPGYYRVLKNGTQVVSPTAWLNNTNITVPVNTNVSIGNFNYTIQYNDSAGNNGTQDSVIITINDVTAPSASGASPTDGSFVSDNTPLISVNITDDASGVNESSIVMTVNGSTVNATTTSISGGFSVSNRTITPYTQTQVVNVTVNATDSYGNPLSYGWSFTVDGNGPILSDPVSTPQTIESNGTDTALLTVNGTDISGIESVNINLSAIGGSANAAMTNSSGTFSITTNATGVGTGSFNLPLNATDNAGNSNTSMSILLNTTDTTAPSLSDYLPVNGTTSLIPVISINATDMGSLINTSSAQMTVEGSEVILANTGSGFTYNFSNTTASAYNHSDLINVIFTVSDYEGQTSNISWAFYIDNVTPLISITSPATGYSTTASSITVSGTVNGTGSPPSVTVNGISADTSLSDFNGTFTATASLSVGTNTIYANVTDAAGNTNSTSISVTRTTTTSPSGGGGGGGGGTTGESYANIKFKDVARVFVNKDSPISFTFDEPENDIQHVQYRALTSSGYVSTTIEILKDTSTFASQAPSGVVYKNINIWVGRAGYATEKNIENPVVGFRVTKKWVTDNNIDASSIKLNRYHDDVWNPLTTRMTGDDATYFYFEAETPGFSPFAITGQQKRFISGVSVRTEATEELTAAPTEKPEGTAITPIEETESTPEETSGSPNLLIGTVILIAIGAYLYMRRQQS